MESTPSIGHSPNTGGPHLGGPTHLEQQQSVDPKSAIFQNLQQTAQAAVSIGAHPHVVGGNSKWSSPEGFSLTHSAKIWFVCESRNSLECSCHLLCYTRREGGVSYDTLGGTRDDKDSSIAACLFRELAEEVEEMPHGWQSLIEGAIASHPMGHNSYYSVSRRKKESHHTTVWFVEVVGDHLPVLYPRFYKEEGVKESLLWRPITDVLTNLNQWVFHQSLVLILARVRCRQNSDLASRTRPRSMKTEASGSHQKKGIIEVYAGVAMMATACVRYGFGNVIATCEKDALCHELLKSKYRDATHYNQDVLQMKDDRWAPFKWDPQRPAQTVYMLVGGPPCTPYSRAGREGDLDDPKSATMQHLVHLAKVMEPQLVIIENVPEFLKKDSWPLLRDSFKTAGYSLVHQEFMTHSVLGGATNRKRVFIWFQRITSSKIGPFPRIEQISPFELPQTVIRDILDPIGCITNPRPLNTQPVWKDPKFEVGQPAVIGHVRWGDFASCPTVEPGCIGELLQEKGMWSVLYLEDGQGMLTFLSCDRKHRGRGRCRYPLKEFTRCSSGKEYPVCSVDGIATTMRASGEYPQRTSCLVSQTNGVDSEIRRLSVEEQWRIQQLHPDDLDKLKIFTQEWDRQTQEDHLYRISGNSIPEPMARMMAQLTQQRILQMDEKRTASGVNVTTNNPPESEHDGGGSDSDGTDTGPGEDYKEVNVITDNSDGSEWECEGSGDDYPVGNGTEGTVMEQLQQLVDYQKIDKEEEAQVSKVDILEDSTRLKLHNDGMIKVEGERSGELSLANISLIQSRVGRPGRCLDPRDQGSESPPLGTFEVKHDALSQITHLIKELSGATVDERLVSTVPATTEETTSQTTECRVNLSTREMHSSFDERGTLRQHSQIDTKVNAELLVTRQSEKRISFTPRLCYNQAGESVDLTQVKAAFEKMVRLSRQCEERKDTGPLTNVAELPFKAGLCDKPEDPFYNPVLGCTPQKVQKAVDEFVQFCFRAAAENDPDRVWHPPEDPHIAMYMSVILTTPLYTWAIGPDGKRHRVLVDSGSAISLLSDIIGLNTSKEFKLDDSIKPITVRGVDPTSTLRSKGVVSFPLHFPVREFTDQKLWSQEDSRHAYTIQCGPRQGSDKAMVFPVDDTRTHVHLEFKGYHFDKSGCGILIGMDLLSRGPQEDLLSGGLQKKRWATFAGIDFRNGCILFNTPQSPMQSDEAPVDFGIAHVPTYYNTPSKEIGEELQPVLVVSAHEATVPPGQTAYIRCAGQCGHKPPGSKVTVSPHPHLLRVSSERKRDTTLSVGPECYVLGRFLPDPNLFYTHEVQRCAERAVIQDDKCPAPIRNSGQRYQQRRDRARHSAPVADSRFRALHKGLEEEIKEGNYQDCGLIVEFPTSGTLLDWSQLDNSTEGKAHLDFHVKVTNTSPVEMVIPAGQPIAEAITATYEDPQRNITQLIREPQINKAVADSLKCVGDTSSVDVDALTLLLTRTPEDNHPMKLQLDAQIPHVKGQRPVWPKLTTVKYALTDPEAEIKAETVCTMVKIHRGLLTEYLMTLIHCTEDHQIDSLGDELDVKTYGRSHPVKWKDVTKRFSKLHQGNAGELGKLRFVLGIHKLLYRFTGLTVSVIADMMNRSDTKEHLSKMFQSCAEPSVLNPISRETQLCNFENLLIIERWVENERRAIRVTPIEDKSLLEGFEFPLYNGAGERMPYTSQRQTEIDRQKSSNGRTYTTNRLVGALSVIVKDSELRKAQISKIPLVGFVESSTCVPNLSAGYACLSLQTLVVSTLDDKLQDLMTVDDPVVMHAHQVCIMEMSKEKYKEAAIRQYGRDPDVKVDEKVRKKTWDKITKEGLVAVERTANGIDEMTGTKEELEAALEGIFEHQATAGRNIEEENNREEAENPALGGEPSHGEDGYIYDVQPTEDELKAQLQIEETKLRAQSWYNSRISRQVITPDKDENGNCITMPWYEWAYTVAWRKLRELEPEETVRGEDPCNRLYTLRSILEVGLPDDDDLERMGLKEEDRILIVESLWKMAPCFYQGPSLPQVRHFTFTRMFMSLVTDVPYRQKPLVIPLEAEELVYTSIRAMIKDGVVEASLSAYNNGLLLVAKKPSRPGAPPSGMRVVLDARGLNHITRRVNWPIEDLSLCLREVAGAAFITVTDVLSGFHLISLDPECRPPTAFTCGSLGHLQYCRAGMGMANSPARFASMLSGVLGVLRHNCCGQGHNRGGTDYAPYPHSGVCSSEEMLKNTEVGVTGERTKQFHENKAKWTEWTASRHEHEQLGPVDYGKLTDYLAAKQLEDSVEDTFTLHRCLCIVYVDDVTIATWYNRSEGKPDHEMEQLQLKTHMKDVSNVMLRMRQFGIVCKPQKTEIARPCNELLGYIVGRDGLKANPKKIDKLMDIDLPRSKEGLNFFIGLAGFYRQFIPRLSELEAPLRKLLTDPRLPNTVKDINDHTVPPLWYEVNETGDTTTTPMASFKAIIMELAKFTALSSIDYRPQAGRVGIAADASRYGLAAVLFQETVCGTDKDGRQLYRERPICYWSKAVVAKDQSSYPYDRELAAITLAVRNWHKYVSGRRLLIVSDHQPLDYMLEPKKNTNSEKKQSSRLLWLIMELSRYDVQVSWRAGKWIPQVDAISRILKVGRIIMLTTKTSVAGEPRAYDPGACDRISLVCSEVPYTREDQTASMIDGDTAECEWMADTSDTEAAIQSVAANPELWHAAKMAILEDIKQSDHQLTGKNDDELYLEYIGLAKDRIGFATECRSKGKAACTSEEWTKYLEIAKAIGIDDPDQRSNTLTPFRHIATSGTMKGDATHQQGWLQIAQGKEWSLSDRIPGSGLNTDVMLTEIHEEIDQLPMNQEDTRTIKLFNCYVTTDHRHKDTWNLDPVYKKALDMLTSEEPPDYMTEPEESLPSCMLIKNPCFGMKEDRGGFGSIVSALITRAQLIDDCSSYVGKATESPETPVVSHEECEAVEEEGKELVCNKVGVDVDVENVHGLELLVATAIESHRTDVLEEESDDDSEDQGRTDFSHQKMSSEIDAVVNFTKVDTSTISKLWKAEDRIAIQHYEATERPIIITWHNVNGIGSFIEELRKEGASYFQPTELCPDMFGILEAKVSQARPMAVGLITVLKELIETLTGHKYVEVRSLRKSTSRCGTVVFLKVSFLETREWWTWSADLEVYDPTYMNLQSAGYMCVDRKLNSHNEWNRKLTGQGDGRVIQILLGPDKRSGDSSKEKVALRVLFVYTRNSSSGMGDITARVNGDELLYQTVFALPELPTIVVGDLNVCVEEEDVMNPTDYQVDHNTIIGCLPHEKRGAQQFIDSGMTSNNIVDRERGSELSIHTAGGMGAVTTRRWLQFFNLDRALFKGIDYKFTSYYSLSVKGREATQQSLDRTLQVKQLTDLMTGSDHTKQRIIIEERKLCDNRLDAASTLKFERPKNPSGLSTPRKSTRSEYVTIMYLVMSREMLDEAAYALSFPYDSQEAQIVWAGLGYRHHPVHPKRCEEVADFRGRGLTLQHRWAGVTPWFKPFSTSESATLEVRSTLSLHDDLQREIRSLVSSTSGLHECLQRRIRNLYLLHRVGSIERQQRKEMEKMRTMRASDHPMAEQYVKRQTERYGVWQALSKIDPNMASANHAWKMGSMIFQPKNPKTQKVINSISLPNRIEHLKDHHTNERYVQNMETVSSENQSGAFGTTRSLDAGAYPYQCQFGPVDRGLRRSPGEAGGRSGLQGMAYAKYMYQASEYISMSKDTNRNEDDPFETYMRPLSEIACLINTLSNRCLESRPEGEQWKDALTASLLLKAMESTIYMYLYRAGSWVECNTVYGNRLDELHRSNQCIPITHKLTDRMKKCIHLLRPMYDSLNELILFYIETVWNIRTQDESGSNAGMGEEEAFNRSRYGRGRKRAWTVPYKWRKLRDLYALFQPEYRGDNKIRQGRVSGVQRKQIACDTQLRKTLRWENSGGRKGDLNSSTDAAGINRLVIQTIVDNRFQSLSEIVRVNRTKQQKWELKWKVFAHRIINKGRNVARAVEGIQVMKVVNHMGPTFEGRRDHLSSVSRTMKKESQIRKSNLPRAVRGGTNKESQSDKWMITWTRDSTASPFPQLDTYIKIDGLWAEQTLNRATWSAVTVREKTYLVNSLPFSQERVTIYVEWVTPISESQMQLLSRMRFECIKTTDEWRAKVRLWDGSAPVLQICTRDPTSVAKLTSYMELGKRKYRRQPSSGSGIGTSGRRPLASDPYAVCSGQDWMSRWKTFMGKTTRKKRKKMKRVYPQTERRTKVLSSEVLSCQKCEVRCCCPQPWDDAEEPETGIDVCMLTFLIGPSMDRYKETAEERNKCYATDVGIETPQVIPRRSERQKITKQAKPVIQDDNCSGPIRRSSQRCQQKRDQVRTRQAATVADESMDYELEKIISERIDKKGNPEFLCRWKGYDESHDEWIVQKDLSEAQELLKEWRDQHHAPKGNNTCSTHHTPGMVYTHNPQTTDQEQEVSMGLGQDSGLETQTPTTFQPQLETMGSKFLRESQSAATAKCPELKILLYLVKNGWKKSPEFGQIEHTQVYDKYYKYKDCLREVNGSIYRARTEEVDSADNESRDRVKPPSCGRELQWIPPLGKRWNLLLQTHSTPDVGHPGAMVMLRRILDVMWWPDITKHVKMLTETCQTCQVAKRRKDPLQGEKTTLRYKLPNSEILIDVIEGLPTARNGWKYIIAITCASSRYTQLFGSVKNDSEAVADAITHWIVNAANGFPRMLRSGRDTGIVSAAIAELLRRLTISNKTLNAWAPQLLGAQERTHTEVGNHIRIYSSADPLGWNLVLPWTQLVHNTSINRITGCTPIMLMKGNPCETLLAASYLPEQTSSIPLKKLAETYVRHYYQQSKDARQRDLRVHNEHILKLQEGLDNQKKSKQSFPIGTKVLLFIPWIPTELNQGLADRWHGPFKVMQATIDSYFLQSTKTNHERNQWIKVSKSRVRKLIVLNEPINVKSALSNDKYMEPDLSPWTAIIENPDLSEGEVEVTVTPAAVTAVLFNLGDFDRRDSDYEGEEEIDQTDLWTQRCSDLLDRYGVHEEQEHPNSSRNYMTGDYVTFVTRVRDNLGEAKRLRRSLLSSQVASIREIPRSTKTDKDSKLMKPDKLTEEEIMNHYVLLPHQGQLRGRTLADVEGSSARFNTVVYCTAAGESLNHLITWTFLDYSAFKRATQNMDPEGVSVVFTNKSRRFPQNTWIEMETPTIPRSYKLLGSWHRYDKQSQTWDPVYGAPEVQASSQQIEDDDYGVDYILMCREGRLSDTFPDEPHYVVRWEGTHLEQHSVIARDHFFSELRDKFTTNQSIQLGDGYFVAKDIKQVEDLQYLEELARKEVFPLNVASYITDRLREMEVRCHSVERGVEQKVDGSFDDSSDEDTSEQDSTDDSLCEEVDSTYEEEEEELLDCFWCVLDRRTLEELYHDVWYTETGSESNEELYHDVCYTEAENESNRALSKFGKEWSNTVHSYNGKAINLSIEQYYEFMQALWKKEAQEQRKSTRVTVNGKIQSVNNMPVLKGINIMFISEKAMTMKGLHVDKEVMITLSGTQPETVRGTITEKLTSVKGYMILIKEKDRESMSQTLSYTPDVTGELEPIDRDTFGLQLDLLVANPDGKLSDPSVRGYILQHSGEKVVGKLVSHDEVGESTHPGLNNSQSAVVNWAGNLIGIGLLFGPPGTGKTHTAAQIILEWALRNEEQKRLGAIFVVATSNVAVDSLMLKFIALLGVKRTNLKIGRLSSRTHSDNLQRQHMLRKYDILQQVCEERKQLCREEAIQADGSGTFDDLQDFIGSSPMDTQTKNWIRQRMIMKVSTLQIIFTTLALAGSTVLKEVIMTQLVMEEAGATPEYYTIPVLSRNPTTTLLIGDFMQLEPVIVCPEVKEILAQSLFQRLWYTDIPKWQLQLQYRLPESVIPFFNENVYNSDHGLQPIMVDPTRKELPLPTGLLIKNPIVLVDSSSIGRKRGEGEETQIINRGFYNSTEAATIVDMVEQLVRCIPGTIATDIGISAPYKMQIGQIQDMIRARQWWPTGFKIDQLLIATADAFQGSERKFMFVSTVRTSYHGLKFAASLRRVNVILSRGSVATFVVSNGRVFGRRDLRPDQKHKVDTREGIEALQRLFEWQRRLDNVYTLDTWRKVFGDPISQINTISNDAYKGLTEEESKGKWEKLYYETWRLAILRRWRPNMVDPSQSVLETSWQQFRVLFRIANNRRILSDTMAYCTQLWTDNIIGTMGGPNPKRIMRDNKTVLTVQESEVPVKGWPHRSRHLYPLLLLAVLQGEKATTGGLYKKRTTIIGIERGQRDESMELVETGDPENWIRVSERSKRSMIGLTTLTALDLGLIEWMKDGYSVGDGQFVSIRLEPLREVWARNDRTHWDQISSYSKCKELEIKVEQIRWQMIAYRYQVNMAIIEKGIKVESSLSLISLMNRLNRKHIYQEFSQYPCVIQRNRAIIPEENMKGAIVKCTLCTETRYCVECRRRVHLKRRWRNIWISCCRRSMSPGIPLHKAEAWRDQIKRHPWYRFLPLITWLSTWEIGLRYLPISSTKETGITWPNPERCVDTNTDITEDDKVWKEWSEECGEEMRKKGIEFYEDNHIDSWWNHLNTVNRRIVLKWLLYDRVDHRWHRSTDMWIYYLGRLPNMRNTEPRTILHSRERPSYYKKDRRARIERNKLEAHQGSCISERDWSQHCIEIEMTQTYCRQLWPNIPVKGPGCSSLCKGTWMMESKEDAFEEQRKCCERIANHRIGEHRDGHLSRGESVHIISPYARLEYNLPLFPDHEADMALTRIGEPSGWRYNVRIINPGLMINMGKPLVDTWLNNGITPALTMISQPGFISGPSQSSKVVYSRPGDTVCVQTRTRLELRDLSRSHYAVQGTAVAKKYGDIDKIFDPEVLKGVGRLDHSAP